MTIVLNGTTGVSDVDGSASTPAFRGTDTNTGMFFPAADTIAFAEGGVEAMRLDSSGNVGIGTSSPSYKLDVTAAANTIASRFYSASGQAGIRIETAANDKAVVEQYTNGNGNWRIGPGITTAGAYEFNSVTAGATRMLIDSSGNLVMASRSGAGNTGQLQVGQTSSTSTMNAYGCFVADSSSPYPLGVKGTSNDQGMVGFFNASNTIIGSITKSVSATQYNTSSDYRLKENIAPMTGALAVVGQLKPCTYTWKIDGSSGQGFIAHELQEVVPECVTGEKDAVNEDGSIKPQGIDTSFLVATLTAAIQELKAELDTVKTELATLKGVA